MRLRLLLFGALFLLSSGLLLGAEPQKFQSFSKVKYLDCYDGDSCRFDFLSVPAPLGRYVAVRLLDIDTPEMEGTCKLERLLAQVAKRVINERLQAAKQIQIRALERKDRYDRVLAEVWVDGESLSRHLMGVAYRYQGRNYPIARSYQGGKRRSWCHWP